MAKLQEKGVILRAMPVDGIAVCPPLIITADEIHRLYDCIEAAMPEIDAMAAGLDR